MTTPPAPAAPAPPTVPIDGAALPGVREEGDVVAVAPGTGAEIGRLTVQAGLRVLAILDTAAGRVGLLASDLRAMYLLQVAGPQSAGALARSMVVPQSVVTLVADRLQGKGLLTRERDASDGRKVILAISPDGRRVLDEASVHVRADLKSFFAPLSPARAEDLAVLLAEVVQPG
ncbi:MarR family winged helix-turn-helix transcriptional regulator [Kineococcus sp. SYSU DK001]|uniref:MarR family winged helix-turn-helix transcriptional regulator n=1 Tax=Kineococcus sp. SYSU DK001 TaxID=3383122 RepID=UPI003D7DE479